MSDQGGPDILLIHGSCHGAWCWNAVIEALEWLGLNARAIDLPSRGKPCTLAAQARAIADALGQDTLLVGHSAAGFAITATAEMPDQSLRGLVYLCAYVPQPGQSLAQMRRAGPSQPLKPAIRVAADRSTFHFDPAACTELFYHDCPGPQASIAQLVPEAIEPQETAIDRLDRAQSLPRHYIQCSEDRAIPPDYQARMAEGLALSTLPSGHSPFLACPELLAIRLAEIYASAPAQSRARSR